MELDTQKYKTALEEEQKLLESELESIGRRNPSNPEDWEPTQGDAKSGGSDRNEGADGIEQYEEHTAILKELETRYNQVKLALTKIGGKEFGICEVGKEKIEDDRLNANPAARTCKVHMNEDLPSV
jgi:RNA polymerase-binding transcription factor DksA